MLPSSYRIANVCSNCEHCDKKNMKCLRFNAEMWFLNTCDFHERR